MTSAQFEFHDFVLIPLGPIHVGGGEEASLLPEHYRVRDGFAERLSARAILARLPEAERRQILRDLDRNPNGFIRALHDKAREEDVIERIEISAESADAVNLTDDGKSRRNQIDAFLRAGGLPTIPGSTIKGALRTAWALEMWRDKERQGMGRAPWPGPAGARGKAARDLEAVLFDLAPGKSATDTDPMRDVIVRDAPLPKGATRVDRVHRRKASHKDSEVDTTGEIYRERLRAVVDGGAPPIIALKIGLRAAEIRDTRKRLAGTAGKYPHNPPEAIDHLLVGLEGQHAPIWDREHEKFLQGEAGQRMRKALDLFQRFSRGGKAPQAALIRIGWAGHAEAKSLAPVRKIHRPQAKGSGRIAREGSTRHVLKLGNSIVPFGWAILIRKDAWNASPVSQWLPPSATTASQTRAARGGSALASHVRYARGSRVRLNDGEVAVLLDDVTEASRPSDEVGVELNGDFETVSVDEIAGPA